MAGFLKRIFSFGKRREEAEQADAPAEDTATPDAARVEAAEPASTDAAPEPDEPSAESFEPVAEPPVATDAEPEPSTAGPVAAETDVDDDPPRPEADMVERAVDPDPAVPDERPLDASRGPEPEPMSVEPEPAADEAPSPVFETGDPGDGVDPSRSPAPPTEPAGGTVIDHAQDDAVALEETDELPTAPAAGPDPEPDPEPVAPELSEPEPKPEPEPPEPEAPAPAARPERSDRPTRYSSAGDAAPVPAPTPEPESKPGFLARLRQGLGRSSRELTQSITAVFTKRKLDDDTLQDLEDVLIRADLGVETAMRITERLAESRYGKEVDEAEVRRVLAAEVARVLQPVARPLELDLEKRPHVILVVGVNGTGKTTTIGKLAAKLRAAGLEVMLAAGDTFRAAAIEQLHVWGDRVGAEVVSTKLGADAAGLAFEAYEKAKAADADVLLIDTAGRLQNRTELMDELAKVVRVLKKHDPDAPHTVLQTLDATTGQNALSQVEIFKERAGVGGLVMTKLDGTARGGILVAIAARHGLPVWFAGVGEGVDDLEPFRAEEFAAAIAGTAERAAEIA